MCIERFEPQHIGVEPAHPLDTDAANTVPSHGAQRVGRQGRKVRNPRVLFDHGHPCRRPKRHQVIVVTVLEPQLAVQALDALEPLAPVAEMREPRTRYRATGREGRGALVAAIGRCIAYALQPVGERQRL